MTCFYQMWMPISLEEDLSSYERGEHIFQLLFWINHLHLCQGWLRYLCDRHLHGNVLQHYHRLGCLLLCGQVSQVFQDTLLWRYCSFVFCYWTVYYFVARWVKSLKANVCQIIHCQPIKSFSFHQRIITWAKEIREDNIDHFAIFSIIATGEYAADSKE